MAEFNCLIHRFSLDVNDTAAQVSLACKRGDTGIQLRIILTDNGIPYEITPGSAAVFTATKPDGTNLYNYCRIEGNTVVYDFTEQTVNVPGQVDVELRLTYGGMVLTSPSFIIIVDETIYDDLVPTSSDEATALTELIGKSEAAVTACESATTYATQSASAAEKSAHEADLAADNARDVAQTVQNMLESGEFQGETSLPVARASSGDGIAYAATDAGSGCTLPTVSVADNANQIAAVGKGRQIVFVPMLTNNAIAPTLQLNDGEIIPIRLRAPKNQGSNDQSPDATLPVPAGALMRGVPYTLTFCGKYWLVDSQITQFDQYNAAMIDAYASALIGLSDGDTIAVPIINSMDGVSGDMATMFVTRSAEENKNPSENGNVTVPTVEKVSELIATAIGDTAAALSDMDSVIGGAGA